MNLCRPLAAALLLPLLASACSWSASSRDRQNDDELLVFAAASLRDVATDLSAALAEHDPNVRIVWAFDGSNVLATQIAEGAPADVFLSADLERPAQLADQGHTAGLPAVFARNRIALVAPLGNATVASAADLAQPGVSIVAAGRGVPITRYADAVIDQLAAALPREPTFADRVERNVVSREDNVRAALTKVELDEGDAAFVYATDVLSSDRVREVPLPSGVAVLADYAAVQVSQEPAAAEVVGWLTGPEAAGVLVEAGFEAVRP